MRILLVKPHPELLVAKRLQEGFLHLEPLELEIVAGGVPKEDAVEILDLSLARKNQIDYYKANLQRFAPDLVGFSGYSSNVKIVKELIRLTKSINAEIITIVGGIHATLLPKDYADDSVDIIVRGEGGTLISELIRRYKNSEPLYFEDRALSPRDPEFNQKAALPPPQYPNVDEIPLPRRDLVDRSRYFCVWTASDKKRLDTMFPRVASLRTSIGCAFSCSFCVIHFLMHKKYLQRSPEDVVDEIEKLTENHIYFVDDEMFLNPKRVTEIAALLIERGIKKHYISWARSDTIVKHPEVFKLWKKAGLELVYVGLESMDDTRLEDYHKRTQAKTNQKAVEILKEIGIVLHAAFIVHPNFTVEDFRRLEKDVVKVCPAEVTFTVFSPPPGTQIFDQHADDFICDPYHFYDCMHTILPTNIPLQRFYQHFGRLNHIALRHNPLRMNKVKVPFRDLFRAISGGIKYISSLYCIYKDYAVKKQS